MEGVTIDDELAHRIVIELEKATSKDLVDSEHAKLILKQINELSSGVECELGKKAVVKVLLASTWSQRLYFIIRSFIMGQIGSLTTLLFIWYFGSIDVTHGLVMGAFVFISSLFISRLFDNNIVKGTRKIIGYLDGHKGIREIVIKYF